MKNKLRKESGKRGGCSTKAENFLLYVLTSTQHQTTEINSERTHQSEGRPRCTTSQSSFRLATLVCERGSQRRLAACRNPPMMKGQTPNMGTSCREMGWTCHTHQRTWFLQRGIGDVICDELCTRSKIVQLGVRELAGPNGRAHEFLRTHHHHDIQGRHRIFSVRGWQRAPSRKRIKSQTPMRLDPQHALVSHSHNRSTPKYLHTHILVCIHTQIHKHTRIYKNHIVRTHTQMHTPA